MEESTNSTRRGSSVNTTAMKESKIVVLGSAGVGKSSLVKQFLDGFFPNNYSPTVEDSYTHFVQLPDGLYQTIEILDTAGLHQFPAMKKLRIESGEAFVIVYAIDSLQSYHHALQLIDQIEEIKGYETFPMVLVGNKKDCDDDREVLTDEASKMADCKHCAFIETSAKSNTNVRRTFTDLLSKVFGVDDKLQQLQQPRRKSSGKLMRKFSTGIMRRRNSDEGNNNNKAGCVIS